MNILDARSLVNGLLVATAISAAAPALGSAQSIDPSFNSRTRNFNNLTPITIFDSCPDRDSEECAGLPDYYFDTNTFPPYVPADPYPSAITVPSAAFVAGAKIKDVNVTIKNISHDKLDDVDIVLVGPSGQYAILASNVSSGTLAVTNLNWKFDDSAKLPLPNSNSNTGRVGTRTNQATYNLIYPEWVNVWTGTELRTFKPTDYDVADDPEQFPSIPQASTTPPTQSAYPPAPYDTANPANNPGPTVTGGSPLSVFNGGSPVGTWSLYIVDDLFWEDGSIGSWAIEITAAP